MFAMFYNAAAFNQPVDAWDTSAVTSMTGMFNTARRFNQCIYTWADKTPNNVTTDEMFTDSRCPYQSDPNPSQGTWCCSASTLSPSASPTAAPTVTPSPTVTRVCEDAPKNTVIDYDYDGEEYLKKRRTCEFIKNQVKGKTNRRKFLTCEQRARVRGNPVPTLGITTTPSITKISSVCPSSCEICPDQCKDSRKTFLLDGKKRKCRYLDTRRRVKRRELCSSLVRFEGGKRGVPLKNLCKETCGKLGLGRCSLFLV